VFLSFVKDMLLIYSVIPAFLCSFCWLLRLFCIYMHLCEFLHLSKRFLNEFNYEASVAKLSNMEVFEVGVNIHSFIHVFLLNSVKTHREYNI